MIEQTLSFEEILEEEEYILVDTSVSTHPGGSGLYQLNIAKRFSDIDKDFLEEERDSLVRFVSFLKNPSVYTSRGVSPELRYARDAFERRINRLENNEFERLKGRNGGKMKRGEYQKKLLIEVKDLFYQSSLKARKSVLKPTQRDLYDSLEKLVFGVTNNTRSKIYFGANYKGSRKGNKEDYHTDEQLVSLALCLSVQGNESCIMTRDSDLRRILLNTVRYLSDPNIFSSQDYLLDSIRGNRIRIYHTFSSGEGELVLDTSEFNPTTRLSREERNGIDQALRD